MSEEPKVSQVTSTSNQSALITDEAVQDFYLRDWLYLGDESLAIVTDHTGAYIVLGIGDRATVDGGATELTSSTSNSPTAITQVVRNSSNDQSSVN